VQIDYFTTISQIINFLVLVFLLRHFLYKPVINAMNEREQKISTRLKEAEQKRIEAEKEKEVYGKMLQELSEKRKELQNKAAMDAQVLQTDLMKRAREEVEAKRAEWYEALQRQKGALQAELRQHASEVVYAIIRHALQDLANEDLENQIINTFIKRLQNMNALEKEGIKELYKTAEQQITVKSTFEIPEEMRLRILQIVNEQIGRYVKMQFKTAPELICGVEMSVPDMRISWSIASYLNALEENLSEVLEQRTAGKRLGKDAGENGKEQK
jgi:F-type H+-transporting ATPase subunit b